MQRCSLPLELPAVHFLCKHSFHQRCLRGGIEGIEGGQVECPLCAQDNATIKALKRSQVENAERHELFKDDLERSEDRFKTIARVVRPRRHGRARDGVVYHCIL